ncbi:MAG TPA: hypothetical protein DD401_06900 [Prevotella sp.]|nr:hypothetical protein [Prevotella sp.]
MKQLSKIQTLVFMLGGALMVVGAGCFAFMWQQQAVCWVFLLGTVLFSVMQMMQTYEGKELTVKRLKRIQSLADILFVVAGILMVDTAWGFFKPMFSDIFTYYNCVYNKWVVVLLIAAIVEVYTMHRLDHELSKKNIKE